MTALVFGLLLSPIAGEDLGKEEWRAEKSIPFRERLYSVLSCWGCIVGSLSWRKAATASG